MGKFDGQVIEVVHLTRKPQPPREARFARHCAECGTEFKSKTRHGEFCQKQCKTDFNNRRRTRGAQLYDFFMTNRYERQKANDLDLWSCMCALAAEWYSDDKGRHTWGDPRDQLELKPYLKKTPDGPKMDPKAKGRKVSPPAPVASPSQEPPTS